MIIPAVFENDFNEVERKIKLVESIAEIIQIDIADGILVNGQTFTDLEKLNSLDSSSKLEIHLMVKNPHSYVQTKIPNVTRVSAHVEAEDIDNFIKTAKKQKYEVGLSIKPHTPLTNLTPFIKKIDYVQFMTVEPGGQGRAFQSQVLDKIREFKSKYPNIRIQADGAINENNLSDVLKSGVDDIVVGSGIFNLEDKMNEENTTSKEFTANRIVSNKLTTAQKKIKTIAFLGGAAWKPDEQPFKDAYAVAKLLAENDYGIVNGGGPGVMRASTMGAHDAGCQALSITYHPNKPKRHYEGVDPENTFDHEIITLDYFDRTKVMLQTTDLHIIFKGSIGTLSELGMTWISSWIHDPDNKPIILYGEFWKEFLDMMHRHFLLVKNEDRMMKICTTPKEVLEYVKSLE